MKSEYMLVLCAVVIVPLIMSVDRALGLYRSSVSLIKAMAGACVPFWIWDVVATARGHWSFNPDYVLGLWLLGMPIEEWLFFVVITFVSIFTWESAKYFLNEKT